ncbi:unnamed protein product [Strongylus vulgaris]|uniref:Uncharacterized protein n=1 Tax=Strongylus vulgaris TaxID=40348 RepID=A0A3P7IRG0_STRVU|nr:unnamed protein product [Strongylus vulgaris]
MCTLYLSHDRADDSRQEHEVQVQRVYRPILPAIAMNMPRCLLSTARRIFRMAARNPKRCRQISGSSREHRRLKCDSKLRCRANGTHFTPHRPACSLPSPSPWAS